MSLEIEERSREGIAILVCEGKLVHGQEAAEFRDRTSALVQSGQSNMILNFAEVDHIDSSGLGELISLNGTAQSAGGKIKLVELNQKHLNLLIITKLDTTFEMFGDEQEAVNSFFPDRQVSSFDLLKFVQEIDGEDKK